MAEYVTIKRDNSYSTKEKLFLIKSDKSLEPDIYAKFTLVIKSFLSYYFESSINSTVVGCYHFNFH